MANAQIGNSLQVSQPGPVDSKLAEITADGANTFTVSAADSLKFRVGQVIVFRVKASGAGFGTTVRSVTGIAPAGVITYSGADIALVPGTHAVYDAGANGYAVSSVATGGAVNINGGPSIRAGAFDVDTETIQGMRDALAVAVPATYTNAYLDIMTENDMRYALRQLRNPTAVRGY